MKNGLLLTLCWLLFLAGAAAQRSVSGIISDGNGDPLIGASVLVKGTSIGTVSDLDGNYKITVPDGKDVLIFSYTGFASQELALTTGNILDVKLEETSSQLSELIVVGYGSQIKSTLTGNIARVKGEDIQNLPTPSVEQTLQGRAAGVFVEAVNGKPGGAVRVRVRGASSISASNQPLYVIDGIPVTTASLNTNGAALNPLADLNPNDIESIEVLKDASAGAIYGSRAANGVVLITTKRGNIGKTNIELNLQSGFNEPAGRREFLNTAEFIELMTEAANNSDIIEGTPFDDRSSWTTFALGRFRRYSGYADYTKQEIETDWQEEAFRRSSSSQGSLTASGGNEKTRFFTSAAWSRQEGVLVGNNFERMSGRLNLEQKATDRLTLGMNMSLSRTFTDQVAADNAFSSPLQLIALAPITPVRDQKGNLYDRPTTTYYNGLLDVEGAQRGVTSFRTLANAFTRYQLATGLTLNGELGTDVLTVRDNAFFGSNTEVGGENSNNGYGTSSYGQVVNLNTKLYANYDKPVGVSNIGTTLGVEYQKSTQDYTNTEARTFPVDDLKTLASAAEVLVGTSTITEFSFLSYFGRVTYDYDRKYLLTLSGRVDGSSRFGENNRFGFFPAVSAGWVISEEDALANSAISFLKLRASYGITGNAGIGNFDHLGLYGASAYNGQSGLAPTQIPNPDLQWEKTAQLDFGLDYGFFDNRLSGEIDYYNKSTYDLLLDVPVPGSSGFRTQSQNIGRVSNKGVEFVLNANILTGDFKWNTGFNIAFNRNNVEELAEGQDIIDPGSSRFMNVAKIGEPLGAFYGAEYAGVDPQTGDAIWYKNIEGAERETTSDFNEAEFVILGNPNPDLIGGFTNTFSYKGLSLSATLQGVSGNQIHNAAGGFMSCNACWFDNQTRDQLDRWQKPGDITNVPQARLGYSNGDQARSSRYLSDGAYLRLRTMTLSYDLPKSLLSSVKMSKARIYILGQNLLTFTKYDGWDPEVSTDFAVSNTVSGVDFYAAPQPKTVNVGLTIGF